MGTQPFAMESVMLDLVLLCGLVETQQETLVNRYTSTKADTFLNRSRSPRRRVVVGSTPTLPNFI